MTERSAIARLLRAMASGVNARETMADVVLTKAADLIERVDAIVDTDEEPTQAHSVGVAYCTYCDRPHINLSDDNGHVFATATMSNEQIEEMVQYIKAHRQ
jgi:hypothetical protein